MTDYLEELLENAGVLLEEVRRVEGSLSAPLWREQTESGGALRDRLRRSNRPEDENGEPSERVGLEIPPSERSEERSSDWPEREARAPETPLLDQLERVEQAVLSMERTGPMERSAGLIEEDGGRERFPVSLSASGRRRQVLGSVEESVSGWTSGSVEENVSGWPSGLGLETVTPGAAAEDWAERADRAFRRDSRRYDGGFYLY